MASDNEETFLIKARTIVEAIIVLALIGFLFFATLQIRGCVENVNKIQNGKEPSKSILGS